MGAYTHQNGNSYRGEFHDGMRTGVGVLMIRYVDFSNGEDIDWDQPAIYMGHFSRSRLNGDGLVIDKSGPAYAGTFRINVAQSRPILKECQGERSEYWTNCIGAYRFANGNVYRDEFADGWPDGIGMPRIKAIGNCDAARVGLPTAGIYVGHFKDGKLSGQGAIVLPEAGYFGGFSDNVFKPVRMKRSGHRRG